MPTARRRCVAVTAREIMNRLRREGWAEQPGRGQHAAFTKPGHQIVPVPHHSGVDIPRGTSRSVARAVGWERASLGGGSEGWKDDGWGLRHYYAIAERGQQGRTWWISFPGRDGIISATDDARDLVAQAQDALASVAMYGGQLPRSIEDGAKPPADLSEFEQPTVVVVIRFEPATRAAA